VNGKHFLGPIFFSSPTGRGSIVRSFVFEQMKSSKKLVINVVGLLLYRPCEQKHWAPRGFGPADQMMFNGRVLPDTG